jgi:hypothetical protein
MAFLKVASQPSKNEGAAGLVSRVLRYELAQAKLVFFVLLFSKFN